jgi:hypothetical protein
MALFWRLNERLQRCIYISIRSDIWKICRRKNSMILYFEKKSHYYLIIGTALFALLVGFYYKSYWLVAISLSLFLLGLKWLIFPRLVAKIDNRQIHLILGLNNLRIPINISDLVAIKRKSFSWHADATGSLDCIIFEINKSNRKKYITSNKLLFNGLLDQDREWIISSECIVWALPTLNPSADLFIEDVKNEMSSSLCDKGHVL